MAFRPFYELKNIAGKIIGKDLISSKDEVARKYINSGRISIYPENFTGSYEDLQALISRETDECMRAVKEDGLFRGSANARLACSDEINALYANVLIDRQSEVYENDRAAKSEFLSGSNTMIIIAAIALILILIVLYL